MKKTSVPAFRPAPSSRRSPAARRSWPRRRRSARPRSRRRPSPRRLRPGPLRPRRLRPRRARRRRLRPRRPGEEDDRQEDRGEEGRPRRRPPRARLRPRRLASQRLASHDEGRPDCAGPVVVLRARRSRSVDTTSPSTDRQHPPRALARVGRPHARPELVDERRDRQCPDCRPRSPCRASPAPAGDSAVPPGPARTPRRRTPARPAR